MAEYWLISAPSAEQGRDRVWMALNQATSSPGSELSRNYKLNLPELRVGTMNTLMAHTDDLAKLDSALEQFVRRIARQMQDLLRDMREEEAAKKGEEVTPAMLKGLVDQVMEKLTVNNKPVEAYVTNWRWEEDKYPSVSSLVTLADLIEEQLAGFQDEMKTKVTEYNELRNALFALRRRTTGTLVTRSLAGIVTEKDVSESENLTTAFVVINKFQEKDFLAAYERLCQMIVPRSARQVTQDGEYVLYSVVLFRRVLDDFKAACRERRWTVRDFSFSSTALANSKKSQDQLERDMKTAWRSLIQWCGTYAIRPHPDSYFGEAMSAWIHIKAIRVFVESVLRYGLPAHFQAMLLKPIKRSSEKKLRDALGKLYGHLGGSFSNDPAEDMPGAETYYPYVSFKINLDFSSGPGTL